MKIIRYPEPETWSQLCARTASDSEEVEKRVAEIFREVNEQGDEALHRLTLQLDGADLKDFRVTEREWRNAPGEIDEELQSAIGLACGTIEKFHAAQRGRFQPVETLPGIVCDRRSMPIERVGLYIPGGSAPLFSTLLMLAIPARLAGCPRIAVVTPPRPDGTVAPVILYTAARAGLHRSDIFKIGGAQAIAALACGTGTVPRVDKVFGPGNRYVTAAKMLAVRYGVAVDLPAGPSEVLVIADGSSNPAFVAADLLAQAEHGPDSRVILVGTSEQVVADSVAEVACQKAALPRREIVEKALAGSFAVVVRDRAAAIAFSNAYAPEHLILAIENPEAALEDVRNAGSVFLGHLTPETLGDYASGTNHTLPTGGWARSYSGVSLDSFLRTITVQQANPEGLEQIGPAVVRMAEAEGLRAHARAVTLRMEALQTGFADMLPQSGGATDA